MKASSESPAEGLNVYQPLNGFRYSAESFWLVGFALQRGCPETAMDIGTGSGIMGGLLAAHGVVVDALDSRKEWMPYWEQTQSASDVAGLLRFHVADVAHGWTQQVDLVLSNPPFFQASQGPGSPNPWKRAARTESTATLRDFIQLGASCLRASGRFCMVLPSVRTEEAQQYATEANLFCARLAFVGRKRVLLEWVTQDNGPYTECHHSEDDPAVKQWYALATRNVSVR